MATSISVRTPASRRKLIRIATAAGIVVLTALVAVALWFSVVTWLAQPKLDGRISVPGISAPVTVTRDAQGVPHISAATLEDLFFAQGYVTAQDRLWQMDMTRRYAAGEMAEVLGSKYVDHDRQQRLLLVRDAARNAAAQLSSRDRAHFEAYARGVNAYIGQAHLPAEFHVLGYSPRPWTPVDSILVATSMVQNLNLETLDHLVSREKISGRLTPQMAAELFPNSSWRDRPPVSNDGQDDFVSPEDVLPQADEPQPEQKPEQQIQKPTRRPATKKAKRARPQRHPQREVRRAAKKHHRRMASVVAPGPSVMLVSSAPSRKAGLPIGEPALIPGSNNWVISGEHTASGKPLLSNDMHLGHQIPNVWYEAHLTSGAYDVAGVTLPGLPYVIAGHNQRIAWGFTNIAPAVADLFIENLNDRGEYQTPEGWRPAEHRREVIRVRRGLDKTVDVTITRHGPIVSSLHPGETRQLALKWTLHDTAALQVPLFEMNSAQNWAEFRQALSRFGNPAQNVVYADVDGHIGYQATGKIPTRASGDGSVPVPGYDNAHEWTGYIPFEQMPCVYDPPSGIIATANGRITPDGYPYVISNEWGSSYRTERIYHFLESGQKFTPADMLVLQTDIYSDYDRFCAQRFVYALDLADNVSPRAREAAEIMRAWDGRETIGSAAPSIVAAARGRLVDLVLRDKIGDAAEDYRWFMSSVWLEDMLLRQPADWLPAKYSTWNAVLAASVEAALKQDDSPRNLRDWKWGSQRALNLQHPIFGRVPILRRWTGPGKHEQSGNGYTVKQVGSAFGPSERMTVDFADLDNSTLNIVTGQSGHIFSKHYMDQWPAWYKGTTFTLPFSSTAVQRARTHELVLDPK